MKPIATSAINIYKATESAAKAAPTFTPKLTKTRRLQGRAVGLGWKLGQQAQTALDRKAPETQRRRPGGGESARPRDEARPRPAAASRRPGPPPAPDPSSARKQAAEQARSPPPPSRRGSPALEDLLAAAPAVTKAYATAAPIIKNTAVKYAAVPAGEALRKASKELQKTAEGKHATAKDEAALGNRCASRVRWLRWRRRSRPRSIAPPPPPEPFPHPAPSQGARRRSNCSVDVSNIRTSIAKGRARRVQGQGPRRFDHRRLQGIGPVRRCGQEDERGRLEGAQPPRPTRARRSARSRPTWPCPLSSTAPTRRARPRRPRRRRSPSRPRRSTGPASRRMRWSRRSHSSVYVPVFAYTLTCVIAGRGPSVLGLVVILVVGLLAKQDDRIPLPAQRATDHRYIAPGDVFKT